MQEPLHYIKKFFLKKDKACPRASLILYIILIYQLPQPHLPPLPLSLSIGCAVVAQENSAVGNAIDLNTLQGSLFEGEIHSLSGMIYSVAETRYCPVLTILTTEKIPRDTARYLLSSCSS